MSLPPQAPGAHPFPPPLWSGGAPQDGMGMGSGEPHSALHTAGRHPPRSWRDAHGLLTQGPLRVGTGAVCSRPGTLSDDS